jgi:lysophospholipase L1-like esterase
MNNSIRDVAESYGIPWINAHDRFESNGSINAAYFWDGLHPNRTGYQVLHDVVAVELAR